MLVTQKHIAALTEIVRMPNAEYGRTPITRLSNTCAPAQPRKEAKHENHSTNHQEIEVTAIGITAEVRYWEDATVNGVEDTDGALIPLRFGDCWMPIIELDTGRVRDWPEGTTADIHYKVCDAGEYELLDGKGL